MKQQAIYEALIYVRVSTGEQVDSGLGLLDQEQRCRKYCENRGWPVGAVYCDAGASGKDLERPELEKSLASLGPGKALVFLKMDRLTRSVMDLGRLTERIGASGGAWVSITEQFDTSTATGRLLQRLIVELAQWEREMISERTRDALAVKRANGEMVGGMPPYGTRLEGKHLVEDEQEMALVRRVREMRKKYGRKRPPSLRAIARLLTEEGHPTRRGGAWGAQTVKDLLEPRPFELRR